MRSHTRLVVFADSRSWASIALVEATGRAALARDDLEFAAVCDATRAPATGVRASVAAAGGTVVRRAFGAERRGLPTPSLRSVCRRLGVPLRVPPAGDVNDPRFVEVLRGDDVELALSLLCPQVFGTELLALVRRAVNYHDGLLPAYAGVRATAWSIYRGERETGLTFHLITPNLDAGPILLEERIAVPDGATGRRAELEKTKRAIALLPRVLAALTDDAPGTAQAGPRRLFRFADVRAIKTVDRPSALTWDELDRRLRAFEILRLALAGDVYEVTRLRRIEDGRRASALAFRTADGLLVEPARFRFLPLPLYRLYRRFARAG
jgi:methionyl-tRNA formyltransferase